MTLQKHNFKVLDHRRTFFPISCSLNDNVSIKAFKFNRVSLLTDGRMLIDNGVVAETYTEGFCLDNFINSDNEEPFVSAFVCNNVVHSMRLPSQMNQQEPDGVCSSAAELKKFRFGSLIKNSVLKDKY